MKYLEGEADSMLADAYRNDVSPDERAYEESLQFNINAYLSLHDQAGARSYEFVQALPRGKEHGAEDAVIALRILRRTRDALRELVQHDEEFKRSFQGDKITSEETDASVRRDAAAFTKRNEVDDATNAAIHASATEGEATEKQVSDAAYGFQDSDVVEHRVAQSARDCLDAPTETADAPLPAIGSPGDASASDGGIVPSYGSPERIRLTKQTYLQQSPSIVFNQAKKWLIDAIVAVVSGSNAEDRFPRIRPLMGVDGLGESGVTHEQLVSTVRDVREMVRALRPPLSESFEDLQGLDLKFNLRGPDGKPAGSVDLRVALGDAMNSFTDMHGDPDEDKYGLFADKDGDQ